MPTFISDLSKKEFPSTEKIYGKSIRDSIFQYILKDNPDFSNDSVLSKNELSSYRERYITDYLVKELGELTDIEKIVLTSLTEKSTLSDKIDLDENESDYTTGQKIADMVASFGGSWKFIIIFGVFILVWILLNIYIFVNSEFDPYPFILLNLILSCLAALQAPVIMMSQNRQEEKDRERSKKDYMINLKSEMEIRILHEKIDHLIMHQQQEMLEIQQIQIDKLNDIIKKIESK